ncbi:MAG: family 1 glycosylhydrolase [Lentisphaeria bacterium]|nr:family 1 glycosylhydrolase [Candidatus Neomarinimicrobiota bacterium]MCF7842975.1 family 1 glycosylhydrolase [Lentisphaeria bacterium]
MYIHNTMLLYLIILLLITVLLYVVARHISSRETHWDWGRINLENLAFPHDFEWGVTSCIFPDEPDHPTNLSTWQESLRGEEKDHHQSGVMSWQHQSELVAGLQRLQVNTYRFGLAWSDIQPKPNEFDKAVLQRYRNFCEMLRSAGIQPVVTLHHLAAPLWFEALGGFERRENIPVFVEFAERVFEKLSPFVSRWITFHEPEVTALQGWYWGNFPPGKKDLRLATRVLANLLDAHTAVWHRLKTAAHKVPDLQIGLTKQMNAFDPARRWHPLDWIFTDTLNKLYRDEVLHYLTEGVFDFQIYGFFRTQRVNPKAKGAFDFLGLDYFTHEHVRTVLVWRRPFRLRPPQLEPVDDVNAAIYPEGLYMAIQRLSHLKKPLYITANGIADREDEQRSQFIRRHIYTVRRALAENYPVKGYSYYSLVDSHTCRVGEPAAYGLFKAEENKLIARASAQTYTSIIEL